MITVAAPPIIHAQHLTAELAAAGLPEAAVVMSTADRGQLYIYGASDGDRETVERVVSAHVVPLSTADRLAAVEAELRGMRERAAAATSLTGGAATVRDVITGPNR